jgi:hypothetical protein
MDQYSNGYFNLATEEFETGMYVTTFRFIKGYMTDLLSYIRGAQTTTNTEWNSLSNQQKLDIINTVKEGLVMVSLMIAGGIAKGAMEDEEDKGRRLRLAYLAYLLTATRQEFTFFVNHYDTYKVLKNPTALTATFDAPFGLVQAVYNYIGAEEDSQEDAFEKLKRNGLRSIPVLRQTTFDPEETLRFISR